MKLSEILIESLTEELTNFSTKDLQTKISELKSILEKRRQWLQDIPGASQLLSTRTENELYYFGIGSKEEFFELYPHIVNSLGKVGKQEVYKLYVLLKTNK